MKIAIGVSKAAALVALAMPAAMLAQYTGISHPDETPISSSPEVPQQPVYKALPAPTPALKPNPRISTDTAVIAVPLDASPEDKRTAEPMPNESGVAIADPDAGIVTRVPGPANQLPIGTLVKVRLANAINTVTTVNGAKFSAELIEPVERDGRVLLPVGSTLEGYVTEIHGGKRISGAASIHLRTTRVTLPDGTSYRLQGQVIDTNLVREVKVDREGTILRRDHAAKTAAVMAVPVASGAAAGAMIAGVPGAVVGAGVGAGVSTVVWLKQDRQADLPVNTKITFSLTEPLRVGGE
jgi:hypothetical protein